MIANAVTLTRTLLTAPLFLLLTFGGDRFGWLPLALFLGCGLLDIVDGQLARRLGQPSRFGAMIDLLGDRLLTLAAVAGLIAGGALTGWCAAAGVILVARDLVVASLNEALPGRLATKGTVLEMAKVGFAFLGLSLLMAPSAPHGATRVGAIALGLAALGAVAATALYWRAAMAAFKD